MSTTSQHVPGGEENKRNAGGVDEVERVGDGNDVDARDGDQLAVAAVDGIAQHGELRTEVVMAGDALLAPGATRRLIEEFTRRPEPAPRPATAPEEITEREREVLTLVGLGLSNTEIADRLHLSLSTAKTHIGRLLMKLSARDVAVLPSPSARTKNTTADSTSPPRLDTVGIVSGQLVISSCLSGLTR